MAETIAVLGAGTMGRGIAEVAAIAGHPVMLYDPDADALAKAVKVIAFNLHKSFEAGRLKEAADGVAARVRPFNQLELCAKADWVLEAAPEMLEVKQDLLGKLGELNPSNILATNTSTLSISAIAAKVKNPERVIGLHFFNPAQRMKLVEVIPALQTSGATLERTLKLAQAWQKEPVQAADSPGFLVNRVARPFYGEALRLHGEGVPTEHLDWVMKGMGFPMGPFELMDLIGLDVNLASSNSVYQGFFGEPRYRPHPLQAQRVAAGMLGRKTNQGWYSYPPGPPAAQIPSKNLDNAPTAYIVGPNALAKELLQKFKKTEKVDEADFVLDCRVAVERKEDFVEHLPVVTLVWGHSASLIERNYGKRSVAGFSLVPPISEASVAEVYAPLSGTNPAVDIALKYFSAHGHLALSLPDQPGGVGFRILALLINEAVSAIAEGIAPADLDKAMRLGTGYPRGPLEWASIVWLKPVLRALEGLHTELGEDRYRPHPLLRRMVAAGKEKF